MGLWLSRDDHGDDAGGDDDGLHGPGHIDDDLDHILVGVLLDKSTCESLWWCW